MKKTCFLLVCSLFLAIGVTSCVSSCNSLTNDISLPLEVTELSLQSEFSRIFNNTVMTIDYSQADTTTAELVCPAECCQYVKVYIDKGSLIVKLSDELSQSRRNEISNMLSDSKLYVTSPIIDEIGLNGSGSFKFPTHLLVENLSVTLNGSGDIDFNTVKCTGKNGLSVVVNGSGEVDFKREILAEKVCLQLNGFGDIKSVMLTTNELGLYLNGSGDISVIDAMAVNAVLSLKGSGNMEVKGKCDSVEMILLSSGDISAKNFVAENAVVSLTGSGDISCNAQNSLSVNVIGSGDVRYRGNPKVVHFSGNDNITKID